MQSIAINHGGKNFKGHPLLLLFFNFVIIWWRLVSVSYMCNQWIRTTFNVFFGE